MKIGFTGTQLGTTQAQRFTLMGIMHPLREVEFHHGDCIGADFEAHNLAVMHIWDIVIHPPLNPVKRAFSEKRGSFSLGKITVFEPKDYIPRNHDIVDDTDMLIATPKEFEEQLRSGTWATVRYARKQHKKIIIIYPDGRKEPG